MSDPQKRVPETDEPIAMIGRILVEIRGIAGDGRFGYCSSAGRHVFDDASFALRTIFEVADAAHNMPRAIQLGHCEYLAQQMQNVTDVCENIQNLRGTIRYAQGKKARSTSSGWRMAAHGTVLVAILGNLMLLASAYSGVITHNDLAFLMVAGVVNIAVIAALFWYRQVGQ